MEELRFPMALPVPFHECSIAANIIGVPSAILFFVLSPGSIVFLLLLVNTPKVILMVRSPFFVRLKFPLSAAFLAATGCLSFFAARIWNEQMETIRAPPLLRHTGSSPGLHLVWTIQDFVGTGYEKKKERGEEKGKSYFLNHWKLNKSRRTKSKG